MPDFNTPLGMALLSAVLPLAGGVLAVFLGCIGLGKFAHWPAILSFASAAVLSGIVLAGVAEGHGSLALTADLGTWFRAGRLSVPFEFALDPLSLMMLTTVTFIATFIAIFSAGYMAGDPGYPRYFAVMSLFVFAMCLLVMANNFFVLLAGWEGVGLCSYLLVGYYYAKPSAAAAARKAFLVTRLGDVGLVIGIFLLWKTGGYHTSFESLFAHISAYPPATGMITTICLFLFCGAVGKSAQLPLYVWLPDAMEGPTPVSALIHAATMVTAGVYLLARCAPLFVMSPEAGLIVASIGGATALLAGFLALAQNDLKRVLAYSTVSQLGFMFLALGCSGAISPKIAVIAALFHLFTHAFFKALLFLGSGSVMHAMGNVIDMRKFGGLRKIMPWTHATFLVGSAALAGFPFLSGFWSKDQILHALLEAGESHTKYHLAYYALFAAALGTAGLTAFYTFRAYFLTFWGDERIPHEAHGHAHESPAVMILPLVVLAVGALFAGALVDPLTHGFEHFLERSPAIEKAHENYLTHTNMAEKPHSFNWTVAGLSTLIALCGIGLAGALYRKGGPEVVPTTLQPLYAASLSKLYIDEAYFAFIVTPGELLAATGRQFDAFLDALARLVSFIPRLIASLLRPLHNGLVQFYALGMVLGLAVFVTVVVFRSAR